MNENQIKQLWQNSDSSAEINYQSVLNMKEEINRLKISNLISSIKPVKFFAIIFALIWIGAGVTFLGNIYAYNFENSNKFFLFSATIQIIITAVVMYIYIYQLVSIYLIDVTDSIINTQKRLAGLRNSTLLVTRISFLQLPCWTTFYWGDFMFESYNWIQWTVQLSVTLAAVLLAIWLFTNIRAENIGKKWFGILFNGIEWTPIIKSMELLEQTKELQNDDLQTGLNK